MFAKWIVWKYWQIQKPKTHVQYICLLVFCILWLWSNTAAMVSSHYKTIFNVIILMHGPVKPPGKLSLSFVSTFISYKAFYCVCTYLLRTYVVNTDKNEFSIKVIIIYITFLSVVNKSLVHRFIWNQRWPLKWSISLMIFLNDIALGKVLFTNLTGCIKSSSTS